MLNSHQEHNNEAKFDLDEIDKKIINTLLEDGRIPYSELAKIVGLSRGLVAQRVTKLREKKVIKKFTITVPSEYFRKPIPVFFDIKSSPIEIVQNAKRLALHDDLVVVYHMSGKNALHIHGFFESIEEVQNFVYDHIYPLPGIEEVSVEFLLKKYKTDIV